jgi:hypothetical protein
VFRSQLDQRLMLAHFVNVPHWSVLTIFEDVFRPRLALHSKGLRGLHYMGDVGATYGPTRRRNGTPWCIKSSSLVMYLSVSLPSVAGNKHRRLGTSLASTVAYATRRPWSSSSKRSIHLINKPIIRLDIH